MEMSSRTAASDWRFASIVEGSLLLEDLALVLEKGNDLGIVVVRSGAGFLFNVIVDVVLVLVFRRVVVFAETLRSLRTVDDPGAVQRSSGKREKEALGLFSCAVAWWYILRPWDA